MSRHWLRMNGENDPNSSSEVNQRHALESLSDLAEIEALDNNVNHQQHVLARAQTIQKANAHKPVFTIYEDPIDADVDIFDGNVQWKKLDTIQHQNKENDIAPGRWNQTVISLSSESMSNEFTHHQPVQPLQVFVDEEFSASSFGKDRVPDTSLDRTPSLRQRLDGASTEEELLAKKPLKNFGAENTARNAQEQTKRQKTLPTAKSEIIAYDVEQLKTRDEGMLSFEEVRARKYATKLQQRPKPVPVHQENHFLVQPTQPSSYAMQSNSYQPARTNSFLAASTVVNASEPFDRITRKLSFATTTKPLSPRRRVLTQNSMALLGNAVQEDVTINTRVAMSEIDVMFGSPQRPLKRQVRELRPVDPVERKLHFSVMDDSVDSVAPSLHESMVNDGNESKQSFHVFMDDTIDTPSQPAQPASKLSTSRSHPRKPLGSREDLVRIARVTNKDMILKLEADQSTDEDQAPSPRR